MPGRTWTPINEIKRRRSSSVSDLGGKVSRIWEEVVRGEDFYGKE